MNKFARLILALSLKNGHIVFLMTGNMIIIGKLLMTTMLTLFIFPINFYIFDEKLVKKRWKSGSLSKPIKRYDKNTPHVVKHRAGRPGANSRPVLYSVGRPLLKQVLAALGAPLIPTLLSALVTGLYVLFRTYVDSFAATGARVRK